MSDTALKIDLFCKVVDNFGDIGVCWRFARQLVRDHGCGVRLFVDDFIPFQRLEPALKREAAHQTIAGVDIYHWNKSSLERFYTAPGDAVIEAFACTLPDMVINLMTATRPVWIDMEYMSAEIWVETCHAIPSLHPATNLTKTLFFPGFTSRTGGLFRDRDLMAQRDAFQSSVTEQNDWRTAHGLPPHDDAITDISLFCYHDAPVDALVRGLNATGKKFRIFAPEGMKPDHHSIKRIKFLDQENYSRLLWTCDVNFVRGEDSFIQSLWAGKPMIWHIYRQDQNVHLLKLYAFLQLYGAESLENFMIMWNERDRKDHDLPLTVITDWFASLPALAQHARQWTETLAKQPDLTTQIVRFIRQQQHIDHR